MDLERFPTPLEDPGRSWTRIVGILNVTPDSFSDGGRFVAAGHKDGIAGHVARADLQANRYAPFHVLPGLFAAAQVTMILLGWAFAQYPHLVEPNITIASAAAPRITLQLLFAALIAGAVLLFPSYYYLFIIFKAKTTSLSNGQGHDRLTSEPPKS